MNFYLSLLVLLIVFAEVSAQQDGSYVFYENGRRVSKALTSSGVVPFYSRRVIGIDVDAHGGKHMGLMLKDGVFYAAFIDGGLSELVYRPENDVISMEDIK